MPSRLVGENARRTVRTGFEATEELEQVFKTALNAQATTVIVVRTQPQNAML